MFTLILMVSATITSQASKAEAPQAKTTEPTKAEVTTSTPEDTFRSFMVAMLTKDEKSLRTLTVASDDFDWLLKGEVVPPEQVGEMKTYFAKLPIRSLKVGDEFTIPGRGKQKVPASDIADDKAVLLPEGFPLPTRMKKVDGKWQVDASPIIAGRKAADTARKKAEAKKAP